MAEENWTRCNGTSTLDLLSERGRSQINKLLIQQRAEVLSHMEASLLPFNRESKGSTFALSAVGTTEQKTDHALTSHEEVHKR